GRPVPTRLSSISGVLPIASTRSGTAMRRDHTKFSLRARIAGRRFRAVKRLVVVMAVSATASAGPKRVGPCDVAAERIATVVGGEAALAPVIAQRCERDRWSAEAQACFATSEQCLDRLTKDQQRSLAGELDRHAAPRRYSAWLAHRRIVPVTSSAM